MAAAYPSTLPLPMFGHTREQPAAFTVAQPRRGWGYVEPTGTDTPAFWSMTWKLTEEQAQTFRGWFRYSLARGTLPFAMQVRTEFGLVEHEFQFLPEGLLPARHLGGGVWEYRATVMARDLVETSTSSLFLLLHGNGSDGNNLVDMSPYRHEPDASPASGLIISTAADAWGGKAIETNESLGAADYRQYTLPFADAGQAFTLEYFLQIISSTGDGDGFAENRQEVLRFFGDGGVSDYKHTANCAIGGSTTHLMTVPAAQSCAHTTFGITGGKTQRVHVAYQRRAGAGTQCFLQGRYVAESGLTTGAMTGLIVGGRGLTSRNARAWIDGLRFMRGEAIYQPRVLEAHGDVVFTPPSVPFDPNET